MVRVQHSPGGTGKINEKTSGRIDGDLAETETRYLKNKFSRQKRYRRSQPARSEHPHYFWKLIQLCILDKMRSLTSKKNPKGRHNMDSNSNSHHH